MSAHTFSFLDNRTIRVTFFLLTLALGIVYFIQITAVSSRGSQLRHLSQKQASLSGETHRIELFIAEESSAQNLQKRVAELGLVSTNRIEYIKADSNSVAMK